MPVELNEEEIPFFAEVIAGGRITIPEEIRKIFEVKDGDHVFCRIKVVRKEGSTTNSKQAKTP
jgi:bifunctional DNA-binding transcriptional regulator/antitoxin component of YhaV-PrlF toxin-antitoxin module